MRGSETAWAKINLALHVRRRMADGYHELETLFAFAEDGDVLSVADAADLSLAMSGPFAAGLGGGPDNLVLCAAAALADAFGIRRGAALHLDKRLPVASGIGGGSADAAATLRLLARHWGLDGGDGRIGEIARALGADVPACLASVAALGRGRGDALTALDGGGRLDGMPLLLVNPGIALSTAAVFADWDGVDRGPVAPGDVIAAALAGRNDLEPAAIRRVPEIGGLIAHLAGCAGVTLARMSGSGATCFALFDTQAARDAAADSVRAAMPGYWCLATRLRAS